MKTGYSLLLGEYIEAVAIDYVDCKNFQIVCPACKEPVFKVNRENTPKLVQYLSHYEKDKSYVAECELRIDALTKEEITKSNSLSRGQRLDYFLSVLKQAISRTLYPQDRDSQTKVSTMLDRLNKSKPLKSYRELLFEYERKTYKNISDNDLSVFMAGYVEDIKEVNSGEFYSTKLALETQKRIAGDIWRHLLSVKARDNYFALFNHAYFMLMNRFHLASKKRNLLEYEFILYSAMEKLINTSVNNGKMIKQTLINYRIGPPYAIENSNLYNKLSSEINHEVLGILLILPYFEMIKKATTEGHQQFGNK